MHGLGVDKRKLQKSVYDVVVNDLPVQQAIQSTKFGDLLPATADLAGAAVELISMPDASHQLGQALAEHDVHFAMEIHHTGSHGLSTADETSYLSHKVPNVSNSLHGWERRMGDFFRECGIQLVDEQ